MPMKTHATAICATVLLLPLFSAGCRNDDDVSTGEESPSEDTTGAGPTTPTSSSTTGPDPDTGSTSTDTGETEDVGETEETVGNEVYFYDHVLPIAVQQCATCHEADGVAPFDIVDYEVAKEWSAAIKHATQARTMPPNPANNDGSCATFSNARWLTDAEIDTIAAWVDGGVLEGDPQTDPGEIPEPPELLGDEITVLTTPQDYVPVALGTPGELFDDYRCFPIDYGFEGEKYLLGIEGVPGNTEIVHHMVFFSVDPDQIVGQDGEGNPITNAMVMGMLDAEDSDREGWTCLAGAGEGVASRFVGGWAPGTGAMNWPENTGIHLREGEVLVVQMHYNLAATEGTDTSTVRISTADSVERVGHAALRDPFLLTVFDEPASLEPGQELVTYTWEEPLQSSVGGISDYDKVEVHSILPHMHGRGRTMGVEFDIDGRTTCGLDVDRWDFNWQFNYFYDQPITMSPTDQVKVTCGWNTSNDTEPVYPGFGTDSEMCLIGLYVVGLD